MAISNYGELKTQLNTYLVHQRFVAQYDNATIKFERVINRRLRVRPMEAASFLTTTNGLVALPADYLKWRSVEWTGSSPFARLDYVHPAYLFTTVAGVDPGSPRIFTIENTTLEIMPVDDTALAFLFRYYQKLPTITSSDSTTNWLLTEAPDAYEYGVLVELFALARNREAAELYKLRRDEVLQEVTQIHALTTDGSSPLVRTIGSYF